jgi:hypothetical protein
VFAAEAELGSHILARQAVRTPQNDAASDLFRLDVDQIILVIKLLAH